MYIHSRFKFQSFPGVALLAPAVMSANAATVTGYTVSEVNSSNTVAIVATGGESALGNGAVAYFIPLGDASGTCRVTDGGDYGTTSDTGNSGGLMSMYLRFDELAAAVDAELNIFFEDLDLAGVNDPTGLFETIDVQGLQWWLPDRRYHHHIR